MTKAEAVAIFGSQAELARAIGVTRSYVSQWADGELDRALDDRVRGAAVRLGRVLPNGVDGVSRTPSELSEMQPTDGAA